MKYPNFTLPVMTQSILGSASSENVHFSYSVKSINDNIYRVNKLNRNTSNEKYKCTIYLLYYLYIHINTRDIS